ncbi:MAG: hypothetical protein LBV70_05490 [Candidatus Adiutrix sp.]|jgi:hypothetical protein|nr:hypothetical protein [Candidatus Adiutrix sp.]
MELYERIDEFIRRMAKSRAALAKQLDIRQTTFNSWFSRGRQNNLWPVLFRIQEIYPHISRDWLFFGEGEMTKSETEGLSVSPRREKELLLKIEQLSGLLIKRENQAADR